MYGLQHMRPPPVSYAQEQHNTDYAPCIRREHARCKRTCTSLCRNTLLTTMRRVVWKCRLNTLTRAATTPSGAMPPMSAFQTQERRHARALQEKTLMAYPVTLMLMQCMQCMQVQASHRSDLKGVQVLSCGVPVGQSKTQATSGNVIYSRGRDKGQ